MGRGGHKVIEMDDIERVGFPGAAQEMAEILERQEEKIAEAFEELTGTIGSFDSADNYKDVFLGLVKANLQTIANPSSHNLQSALDLALYCLPDFILGEDEGEWTEHFVRDALVGVRAYPVFSSLVLACQIRDSIHLRAEAGDKKLLCGEDITREFLPVSTWAWFKHESRRCGNCDSEALKRKDISSHPLGLFIDSALPIPDREWEEVKSACGKKAYEAIKNVASSGVEEIAPNVLEILIDESVKSEALNKVSEFAARNVMRLSVKERFEMVFNPISSIRTFAPEDIQSLNDCMLLAYKTEENIPWPTEEVLEKFYRHIFNVLQTQPDLDKKEEVMLAHLVGQFFPEAAKKFLESRRFSDARKRPLFDTLNIIYAPRLGLRT
jgi:hypothetical protein